MTLWLKLDSISYNVGDEIGVFLDGQCIGSSKIPAIPDNVILTEDNLLLIHCSSDSTSKDTYVLKYWNQYSENELNIKYYTGHFEPVSPPQGFQEDDYLVLFASIYDFSSVEQSNHITIQWNTTVELDSTGFHIWRAESDSNNFTRITDSIIISEGNFLQGASYSYTDINITPGKSYRYQLEDIDLNGNSTFHLPSQKRSFSSPDIFAFNAGNTWSYSVTTNDEDVIIRETVDFDPEKNLYTQKSFDDDGNTLAIVYYDKTESELKMSGFKEGEGVFLFNSGLTERWYPMNLHDHKKSQTTLKENGLMSFTLEIDVIDKENISINNQFFPAYKLNRHLSGKVGASTFLDETSTHWVMHYLPVIKSQINQKNQTLLSFSTDGQQINFFDNDADGCVDDLELRLGGKPNLSGSSGDANNDCRIDMDDLIFLLQTISDLETQTLPFNQKSDVNGDNEAGLQELIDVFHRLAD